MGRVSSPASGLCIRVTRNYGLQREVMLGDGLEGSTIRRTTFGALGFGPGEQQSRHEERCPDGAAVRRQGEEGGDRDQNEQGSNCLESVPGTFIRWSLIAESLRCAAIDAMGRIRSHRIVEYFTVEVLLNQAFPLRWLHAELGAWADYEDSRLAAGSSKGFCPTSSTATAA